MTIKAESRHEKGKKISNRLRREGKIPAIIYGEHQETLPISLLRNDVKAVLKADKGMNTVLKIQKDTLNVDAMLKEVQYDYLSESIIHADFIRIDLNKPVFINIPIITKGEPIGVKLEDGFFDFITREIKVKCLPTKIPSEYVIDVSGLHAGNSIKAENLDLGEDIKLVSDPHKVICAVSSKSKLDEGGKPGEAAGQAETKSK
ncbi:MAG: 50S ribosomal protein L25 [Candidatus Omnitrophota bacterium]